MTSAVIPVVLFTYARPTHLARVLECLRQNDIPLLYIFSDGPRGNGDESKVADVRAQLHAIDWCETVLVERPVNMGLGRSVLAGVTEVLKSHEAVIVFEDDLICVPGTYKYLCAALAYYQSKDNVMSVTGWTHPLVTPKGVTTIPYFDGRAESWVWGTWSRVWQGMVDQNAEVLIRKCEEHGIDVYHYGADVPAMAKIELRINIWWVRFMCLHMLNHGLCLHPPWSMVEHLGFDQQGTNAKEAGIWVAQPLRGCPPIPVKWPDPIEQPECSKLWRRCCGKRPTVFNSLYDLSRRIFLKIRRTLSVTAELTLQRNQ